MLSPLTSYFSEDGWMDVLIDGMHFLRAAETGIFELRSTVADAVLRVTDLVSPPNEKQNDGVKFQLSCDRLLKRTQNCFSTQITLFILIRHFLFLTEGCQCSSPPSSPPTPPPSVELQETSEHEPWLSTTWKNRQLTLYSSNDDDAQCSLHTWADTHTFYGSWDICWRCLCGPLHGFIPDAWTARCRQ